MVVKSRQAQHSADTRQGLVDASRKLFSRHGYRATSLDEVCDRARVTKGALYHHFDGKDDLFVAVLDDIETELVQTGAAASDPSTDVWERIRAGCQGFLDVCVRSDTRRILIEAPGAVGWERARHVHSQSLGLLEAALTAAAAEGIIRSASPAILAQLLFGLFGEAAAVVAGAEDPKAARVDVGLELDSILAGLRTSSR